MIKKQLIKVMAGICLLSTSISVFAANKPCREIKWYDSKPLTIYADMYKHVHVKLPSNLIMEPVNINNLWEVTGKGTHLFISPTSNDQLGKRTTISALTEDGNSYDFVVESNDRKFNPCVNIVNKPMLSAEQMKALEYKSTKNNGSLNQAREISLLKSRYKKLLAKSTEEKEEAVKQAIRKYRFHIYTRYQWKSKTGKKSFMNNDLLSDVYDDGRFTYIRLTNDNKTLPALQALVNGNPEFIESKYDEVADLYRVVGIYPELSLVYGEDSINIERVDKSTRGEF